jgi:hypothetical protein
MRTRPVKVRSTSAFRPRVMFTASTPAFAGTSRAVKKYLPVRTPLPAGSVTSLGTTRSASGADLARSLVATYSPGSLTRALTCSVRLRRFSPPRPFRAARREQRRGPFCAGTNAPQKETRRPYLAGFGPASVRPYAVTVAVCVAVSPPADCAVRVAVQRPAAYVCSAMRSSAELPSPKYHRYVAASPVAVKVTCNGAAPAAGVV